jgi:hypothetical protein
MASEAHQMRSERSRKRFSTTHASHLAPIGPRNDHPESRLQSFAIQWQRIVLVVVCIADVERNASMDGSSFNGRTLQGFADGVMSDRQQSQVRCRLPGRLVDVWWTFGGRQLQYLVRVHCPKHPATTGWDGTWESLSSSDPTTSSVDLSTLVPEPIGFY